MKKHRSYLDVDWVELGCRGWDIYPWGAVLVSPDENSFTDIHLSDLSISGAGDGAWWRHALQDLADAGVLGLESWCVWQVSTIQTSGSDGGSVTWRMVA